MPRNFASFQNVGVRAGETDYTRTVVSQSQFPVGIKTPVMLDETKNDLFLMNMSVADQIDDNLRNLIQANHGERLIYYDWGANLQPLTSEFRDIATFNQEAMVRINTAVNKWMPFVQLTGYDAEAVYESTMFLGIIDIYVQYSVQLANLTERVLRIRIYVM